MMIIISSGLAPGEVYLHHCLWYTLRNSPGFLIQLNAGPSSRLSQVSNHVQHSTYLSVTVFAPPRSVICMQGQKESSGGKDGNYTNDTRCMTLSRLLSFPLMLTPITFFRHMFHSFFSILITSCPFVHPLCILLQSGCDGVICEEFFECLEESGNGVCKRTSCKNGKKVVGENDDCVRPTQLCDAQNLSCKNSKFFRCSVDADSMETGKCERFKCKNKRRVVGVDGTCVKPRCDAEGESCRNKRFFTCNTETGKCDRTRCKRRNKKCLGTDLKCHWKPDNRCVA
jgi:hypothetical protein